MALHAPLTPETKAAFRHLCSGCDTEFVDYCASCEDFMPGYLLRADVAPMTRPFVASDFWPTEAFDGLRAGHDRMIAIQMDAYPAAWSEDERREMAVQHLFGERAA